LKEGSSADAYMRALQEVRFALFRSEAWAVRAFETMRRSERDMNLEQLQSLHDTLNAEQARMIRARMGFAGPDIAVWEETLRWLDDRIRERRVR